MKINFPILLSSQGHTKHVCFQKKQKKMCFFGVKSEIVLKMSIDYPIITFYNKS